MRYRDERHQHDELLAALRTTGANVGAQLTLAAAAVTAAFFSFTPTDYRGLSELGIIAGSGMIIAFTTSITLLPALLSLLNPPPEPKPLGFAALAPVDRFMERHRIAIIVLTGLVALGGLPLLYFLRFDFNPLNLRNPNVESVATFLELKRDPDTGINAIQILAPSLSDADAVAKRVAKLPEVSRTTTLSDFVPEQQDEKLALIRKASAELGPTINPQRTKPAPSDAENVRALNTAADGLKQAANEEKGPGASAARRLSLLLSQLAKADAAVRGRTEAALIPSLKTALDELRKGLRAEEVTPQSLPEDLRNDWVTPDGRARVEVSPKGDPNDNETLRKFATAVLAVEPTATGAPVSLQESGHTVVRAFIEARALDAGAAAARRRGHAGTMRPDRASAQLRQHHRPAAAARRRGRLQDLLHHGVAGGHNQSAAVEPDPRGVLQRHDDGDGVRQPVDVEPPGDVQHGEIARAVADLHARRRGAVPAGPYGATARQAVSVGLPEAPAAGASSHFARAQLSPPQRNPMTQPSILSTLALVSPMLPE